MDVLWSEVRTPSITNGKISDTSGNIWRKLPRDIVNYILTYDGQIIYRFGMYMNIIPHPDITYPLLLERMRFQRYRRFYKTLSFVTIILPTEKNICYWAIYKGLQITLFTPRDDNNLIIDKKILFTNIK